MVSALPIALSANIARVMLTGYIMHFVNPQFALGTYHTLEGLLMMGFGLLLLHCECWVLDQICQLVARGGREEQGSRRTRGAAVGGRLLLNAATAGDVPERPIRVDPAGKDHVDDFIVRFSAVRSCRPAWRPRRAWSGSTRPTGRRCGVPWLRFRWSSATGSARTSRSTPTSSSAPRRPNTSTGPTRAGSSPGSSSGSGSTIPALGTNLRHTPEICLPSGGWTKIESQTRVIAVPLDRRPVDRRSRRLGY